MIHPEGYSYKKDLHHLGIKSRSNFSTTRKIDFKDSFGPAGEESVVSLSNIIQVDGNVTLKGTAGDSNSEDDAINKIEVIVGNRPERGIDLDKKCTRKTIRRTDKGELLMFLPNVAVYNHRSLWKKNFQSRHRT